MKIKKILGITLEKEMKINAILDKICHILSNISLMVFVFIIGSLVDLKMAWPLDMQMFILPILVAGLLTINKIKFKDKHKEISSKFDEERGIEILKSLSEEELKLLTEVLKNEKLVEIISLLSDEERKKLFERVEDDEIESIIPQESGFTPIKPKKIYADDFTRTSGYTRCKKYLN